MIRLIRFFEREEWAEDFLDGKFYMNSIGHFWKAGIEQKNDFLEGTGESISLDQFEEYFGTGIRDDFGDHILDMIQNRIEAYKYCHILCMLMHEYDPSRKEAVSISPKMSSMGEYTVMIYDVQSFVDRIFEKMLFMGQYGLMGPVSYHAYEEKMIYSDCFDKYERFRHECEWRFALIPDYDKAKEMAKANPEAEYDTYIVYDIGSIRDIAKIVDKKSLIEDAGALYCDKQGGRYKTVKHLTKSWAQTKPILDKMLNVGLPISYDAYPEQYVGWAPREAFKKKVISIDGGLIKPIFTIGI